MFYTNRSFLDNYLEMILQNDMHSGTPAMRLPSTEQTAVCGSIQTKEVFPVSAEM